MMMVLLLVQTGQSMAGGIDMTVFGPKRYDRLHGKPTVYTDTFERCNPSDVAVIKVQNGDSKHTRIKAGRIYLNGSKIAGEKDFKHKVPFFEKQVQVRQLNELKIILKSGHHDYYKRLAEYRSRQAELAKNLEKLQALQAKLVALKPPYDVKALEKLLHELRSLKTGLDEKEHHLAGIGNSLDDDGHDYHEDEDRDDREGDEELSGTWVRQERNDLDKIKKETEDAIRTCKGAMESLEDDRSKGKHSDNDRKKEHLSSLLKELDQINIAINRHQQYLDHVAEKIDELLKRGPSFLVVEVIGKGCDSSAPVITAPTPVDGALLNTPQPVISAAYADEANGSGINPASAKLLVDGTDVSVSATASATGISYTPAAALADGPHIVSLSIADRAANGASLTWSFATDTVAPIFTITSHSGGQYINTPVITLAGSVDDPKARLTVNGVPAQVSGNGFSLAGISLTEGKNILAIEAWDPAGNSSTAGITLNLDTIAPALTVSTLSDGAYTNNDTLNISGTVTDAGGVDRLLINGTTVSVNGDGSYSHAIILKTGTNGITVEAIDKATNKTTDTRTINLDQTAPRLDVTSPADNSKTGKQEVTVTGTVDEQATVQVKLKDTVLQAEMNGNTFTATIVPEYGYNTIEITATDLAANTGSQKRTVIFDNKQPSLAIADPPQDMRTNKSSLELKGTAGDADGLTAVNVIVSMDGETFAPAIVDGGFTQPLTFRDEKTYAIVATATDEVGNATTVQRNVIYDVTPPALTVNPVTTPTNQASQVLSGTREEGAIITVTSATAAVGDISYPTPATWQTQVSGFAEAPNQFTVNATDIAGNVTTISTQIVYDITPPVITVVAPAAGAFLRSSPITISGSINEPVARVTAGSITATLEGQNFAAPQVPLNEGINAIAIKAIDLAGNEGTVSLSVNLDTIAPVVTISAPTAGLLTRIAQVSVSGAISEQFTTVTVNGSAATVTGTGFSSPHTLAEGVNSVTVQAVDRAGNTGTATVELTLDSTPPAAPVLNSLATPTNVAQVTITGTAEAGSTVKVLAAGGLAGTVSADAQGTFSLSGVTLAEGTNTFTATAIDAAANESAPSAPVSAVLDITPPVVTIGAPTANAYLNTQQVTVSGTVSEPVASVTVNNVSAVVNGLSFSLAINLTEGANTIAVMARDSAGNEGSSAVTLTLDTKPPQVTIATPAAGLLTKEKQVIVSGTVSEEFTVVTVGTIAAAVSGVKWSAAVTLTEGPNKIAVTATDRAGNTGSSTVDVTLDSTSPAAPLLNAVTTPTNVAQVAITGMAEAASSIKIFAQGVLIGTVTADPQGNFALAGVTLAEGSNSYTATATDAAGNESLHSLPLAVVLDTKAPVITVTAPEEQAFFSAPGIVLKGSVDEALATLNINGQATTLDALNFSQSITLTPGLNTITLVATDLAGNQATKTILVTLDNTPPTVTITAPLTGTITKTAQIAVSGTISKPNTTATINGTPITVTGQAFSLTYTLSEGDNILTVEATDRAGNKGSASVSVSLDSQPPALTLQTVTDAAAGANVAIVVNASDNRQLTLVELKADGVPIWSGGSAPTIAESVSYRLSPSLNAGSEVVFQARGIDTAGNEGSATARIGITQAAMGPGFIQGKVLDDGRGLLLSGAQVTITSASGETKSLTTTADGGYFSENSSGTAVVAVTKPGFTTVERIVPIMPEKKTMSLDARLTGINDTKNLIDAAGGTIRLEVGVGTPRPAMDITVPANALSAQADIRVTPVSNQGLAGLLPVGWSPLAALDVRLLDPTAQTPLDATFAAAATVKIPLAATAAQLEGVTLTLARYDSAGHQWHAAGSAAITDDSLNASAEITAPGQYALVMADPAPNAPAVAQMGAPLAPAASTAADFALITTAGKVVPQASPPSTGLKAAGEVLLTAKDGAAAMPQFTSGLVLNNRITEKFDLKTGDAVEPASYTQDLVLYRQPCITNIAAGSLTSVDGAVLRATFPVSPSKDFTIVDLLLGKVGIEIVKPETADSGVMVGADGGRLVDADGNILSIPQGALSQTTPVATRNGTAATGAVGSDFILLKVVDVNLTRQTLAQSATLSIAPPAGFDPSLPVVVARQIDVKGVAKLKLVALARQSGSLISSDTTASTITLPGITTSGLYYVLQAKGQIGFAAGMVTDSTNTPFTGALVKTDKGSLVDLTPATGKYLVALPTGVFAATAVDLYKNDEGSATGSIDTPFQAVSLDLKIVMIPPTVVSVTPTGANVQPSTPVVVTFSKSMDQGSINSQTLKLLDSAGSAVSGVFTFSVDGKIVTFTPSDLLTSLQTYTITVGSAVKDLQGYSLGRDVTATFTIRDTTPPPMPPAGSITATFPDADGYITVTATQGSAPTDCTVLIINDTTGEIVSVTPASNGSFTKKIRAQLGEEIKVVLMDASGNQTLVTYITYKSDDGKYLVTAKGGKVEGEGGSVLEIPEGALAGPTVIRITAVAEESLPHPVPSPGKYMAALNVDAGGVGFQKEVHLSIPVPPGHNPDTAVFVTRPEELVNPDGTVEKVYSVVDSTKIVDGRITTASPPFDGIWVGGTLTFTPFPELHPVIVSGYTYQDMDGFDGYTQGVDKPVRNAIIRSPGGWNYISHSNSNGFYATFTEVFANILSDTCRDYEVTAIHPQTMRRETKKSVICEPPFNIKRLNFKLADKTSTFPDKTPPVIGMSPQVVPGQPNDPKFTAGAVPIGTDIDLNLSAIDQEMKSLSITVQAPGEVSAPSVPVNEAGKSPVSLMTAERPAIYKYLYTPSFSDSSGMGTSSYFRPTQPGVYTFKIEAKDGADNISRQTRQIQAVIPGEAPIGIDGPPAVIHIVPDRGATDVMVTSQVTVYFSEPVENVTNASFYLKETGSGHIIPGTITLSVEGGKVKGVLTPSGGLSYGKTYDVVVTTAVRDVYPNASTGGGYLSLAENFVASFSTKEPKIFDLPSDQQSAGGWDIALYNDQENQRTYAYITEMEKGWKVADVTDSTAPTITYAQQFGSQDSFRYAAVEPQARILGITESLFGLKYGYVRFYDLRNPAAPPKIGQERLAEEYSGVPSRLAISGKYAYVATVQVGLQVVDVDVAIENVSSGSSSTGKAIVGVFDTLGQNFGQPWDITVYGSSKAILTTSTGYFLTLDLSVPQLPQLMNALRAPSYYPTYKATRVAVAADFNYLAADGSQQSMDLAVTGAALGTPGTINTVDVTDPYNPKVIGTAKDANDMVINIIPNEITVNKMSGMAFVTTGSSIKVFNVKDPYNPRLVNEISTLTNADGAAISIGSIPAIVEKDGTLYMSEASKGMRILDLESGLPACVGGENCSYELERVYHLSKFSSAIMDHTDSYKVTDLTVDTDTDVKVSLVKTDMTESLFIDTTTLRRGTPYRFVIDYQTLLDAGFKPGQLYILRLNYVPKDGSSPYKKYFYGRLSERTDGKMLGQTIVHDVMLQDGSLNLSRQDFAFQGRGPQISFSRSYSNQSSQYWSRVLGNGWSHSLDRKLVAISSDEYSGSNALPDWLVTLRSTGGNRKFHEAAALPMESTNWAAVSVNGVIFKKSGSSWSAEGGRHGSLIQSDNTFIFTDKDGTKHTYGYPTAKDKPASIKTIGDRNGNLLTFEYNASGLLSKVTDAVGRVCNFAYSRLSVCEKEPDRLVLVSCPDATSPDNGIDLSFNYDSRGYLEKVKRGEKTEIYAYAIEPQGSKDYNLVQAKDANNNQFIYEYFAAGGLPSNVLDSVRGLRPQEAIKSVSYPDGKIAAIAYDAGKRTVTDLNGNDTTYTLNTYGNPKTIEEPMGKTTAMTWSIDSGSVDNQMTSRTDALGYTTSYEYDANGNITKETDANGKSIVSTWNGFSLPLTRTDRNGVSQSWTYDGKGNLTSQTDGESKTTSHSYNDKGDRISTTDGRGFATTYTYDGWGLLQEAHGPEGSTTRQEHDFRGRLAAMIDANGRRTGYRYDRYDNVIGITYPTLASGGSGTKTFTYDLLGNLLSETDRAGLTLTYAYTPRNQVKEITRSGGGSKTFDYDANGNLTKETDWKGRATTHAYDALNRRTGTTNRLGHSMSMQYDLNGNLTQQTDYEGRTTTFTYDALNRVTKASLLSAPGGDLLYSYFNEADPKTNLQSETDQEGHVTQYTYNGRYQRATRTNSDGTYRWNYDDNGNLAGETDEEGRSSTYEYDKQNRLTKVNRPLGAITGYQYDAAGNRTQATDPRGFTTITAYDEWNRPWKVTDPENFTVTTEYDGEGRDTKTTDGNGVVRQKTRDSLGQVLSFTNGEGKATTYTYDENGNVLTVKQPNDTVTTNTYDAEDRLLTATEAGGSSRTREIVSRDKMGNPLQVKDYNGNVTTSAYNALNLPTTVTDALGKITVTDYYKTGKVKSIKDRRGNSTTYEYDGQGRVTKISDPLGKTITTSYDKVGNVKAVADKRGIATTNTYDALNRLTEQSRAGIRLVTNDYDKNGNKIAETDADNNRTDYTYTKRNLVDTVTFADGTTRKRTYDGNGNLKTETDELNRVATYTYDRENRPTSVEFASETTSKEYDAVGNLTRITKPLGNSRSQTYDGFKRLTSVTEGGLATSYAYDDNGNLLKETDPKGNDTTFAYDALNRKTAHTLANGSVSSYSYDEEGNVATFTDAKGQVINYNYDQVNRPVEETYTGTASPFYTLQKTTTTYDGNNNVTQVQQIKNSADSGTVTDTTDNVYDNFDRLTSSTQRGVAITYAYDNNGNRTGVTTPNGTTTYTYDNRNRPATATSGTGTTTFAYYADGSKQTVTYPNGATENLTYYPTSRVKGIVNKTGSAIISSYAYDYDKNGNRTKLTELQNGIAGVTTYGYDNVDRLLNHTLAAGVVSTSTDYTYDGYNRASEKVTENGAVKTNKTYSYDNVNRLLQVTDSAANRSVSYTYDANGNTIKKTDTGMSPAYADTYFDYDSLNRLVQAQQAGMTVGRYDYDENNLRIRHRSSDRGSVDYYYDGNAVIEERHSTDNTLLARYTYADQLLAMATPKGNQFYHHDALGSTVNLTNDQGATEAGYILDPWGHIVSQSGDSVNRQIFTGQEHDQETGLIYFGARYYDPDTGRFISQDDYLGEQGEPPSLHRYLYAYSNPLLYFDEDGYASVSTMIDNAADGCSGAGCYGWAFLKTLYSASTLGFASVHDPQRDAYDEGKISGAEYSIKGIGGGGALVAANVLTGRAASAAMVGKTLLQQTAISATTGALLGAGNDAAGQLSNIDSGAQQGYNYKQTAVSALLGGVIGGAAPVANLGLNQLGNKIAQTRIGSYLTREPRSGFSLRGILSDETGAVGSDVGDLIVRNKTRSGIVEGVGPHGTTVAEEIAALRRIGEGPKLALTPSRKASFGKIVEDVDRWSLVKVGDRQKKLLFAKSGTIKQRSSQMAETVRDGGFSSAQRRQLLATWEEQTGMPWPRGATPHHVIPLKSGGANEWWNLIPVRHPHTGSIHGTGSALRSELPYNTQSGTITELMR